MNFTEIMPKIAETVEKEMPFAMAELATEVFDSMGSSPTDRGWTPNSENTRKREGIAGKFHRNIDTGQLRDLLSTPGVLMDDGWFGKLPDAYKDANKLGRFDSIGKTPQDEEFVEKILERELATALK